MLFNLPSRVLGWMQCKCLCRVNLLTDGLKGKSRWLRKAPLEICHPDRKIFEGQEEVLIFAAGSAAKEQWFTALSVACKTDGGNGMAIAALYSTFCDHMRAVASVAYPQVPMLVC
jgi:hypothetical protein